MSEDWRKDPRFNVKESKKEETKRKKEMLNSGRSMLYFIGGLWVLWQIIRHLN